MQGEQIEAMQTDEPILTQVKNGWHCGSRALNLTVFGPTPEEARRLYDTAVEKASEIRSRPEPNDPDHFANPS
jgi:hypothetical protein